MYASWYDVHCTLDGPLRNQGSGLECGLGSCTEFWNVCGFQVPHIVGRSSSQVSGF